MILIWAFDRHEIADRTPELSKTLVLISSMWMQCVALFEEPDCFSVLFRKDKSKRGGKVIATEPFFSLLSIPAIFKYLHHEPGPFLCISRARVKTCAGAACICKSSVSAIGRYLFSLERHWLEILESRTTTLGRSSQFGAVYSRNYLTWRLAAFRIDRPIPRFALPRVFPHGSVSEPLFPAAVRIVFYGNSTAPLMSRVSALRSVGNKLY